MENAIRLPPGFRFHPTDEELVEQYLRRKIFCYPLPASIIPDIELSRYDPWDIPGGGAGFSEKERYFFTWRGAKHRSGSRSNRLAGCGYWKSSGKEQKVMASRGDRVVGMKRALVFYRGRPSHGSRTGWVMHEYRLVDTPIMQMEGWVLCCMFQKRRAARGTDGSCMNNNNTTMIGNPSSNSDSELSCVTELSEASSSEEEEGSYGTGSSRLKKRGAW